MGCFVRCAFSVLWVVCASQLSGCRKSGHDENGVSADATYEDARAFDIGNFVDDNWPARCWQQHWDSGKWFDLTVTPGADSLLLTEVSGSTLAVSVCTQCSSIRIIDMQGRRERIILSQHGHLSACRHSWKAGANAWSQTPIEQGDILLVVYKYNVYAIRIMKFVFDPESLSIALLYEQAQVDFEDTLPHRLDISALEWKEFSAAENIPIDDDRDVPFSVYRYFPAGSTECTVIFSIWYDYYYGGPVTGSAARIPMYVALVDHMYLQNRTVIELDRFGFKSWEDGLGNRSDACLDSRGGEQ